MLLLANASGSSRAPMLTEKMNRSRLVPRFRLPYSSGPIFGNSPVNVDGPGHSILVPQSPGDFMALGVQTPSSLWLMQEASGDLASTISGGITLTATNTPTYRNSVTNWKRLAVDLGEASGRRFTVAAGSGPNPASTSVAWLTYFRMTAGVGGANRRLVVGAAGLATTGVGVNITTANVGRIYCVNVASNGTTDYSDGLVHPMLLVYDRTGGTVTYYTDKEQKAGTYSAGVVDAEKGFGENANLSGPVQLLYGWAASGSVAESYGKNTLTQLGWPLAY